MRLAVGQLSSASSVNVTDQITLSHPLLSCFASRIHLKQR